jgi:hypothetical protein
MIRKLLISILPIAAIILFSAEKMSDNGKAGKTGSPGELTCIDCHDSYTLNSGGGSILFQSPSTANFEYSPGQTYTMSVTVSRASNSLFGVGIEALTASNNNAGTLNITDAASTTIKSATVSGVSRRNVVHKLNGGANPASKVFNFSWTAPTAGTGPVTFYYSGVAANSDGDEKNDYVYAGSQVINEVTCSAPAQPAAIIGSANTCSGVMLIYSVPADTNATSYSWTLPSGWTGASSTNSITVTSGSNAGTISVVASNNCGVSTATTLPVSISTLTATITPSGGVLLASAGTSYEWYLDGTIIPGATGQSLTPVLDGNYSVVVYDSNGCSGTSTPYYYSAVGIYNIANSDVIDIFPNPASSLLTVNVNKSLENHLLKVYDISGRIVFNSVLENGINKIDVSSFPEGVYVAETENANGKIVKRILISR